MRPTSRPRSPVAAAIIALRENLQETQDQFARRLRVTPVSQARYETHRMPSRAILERLARLALKHHPPSAKILRLALDDLQESKRLRRRMGAILDPGNLKAAAHRLLEVTEAQKRLKQMILGTPSVDGVDQHILIAAEEVEEQVRKLADLMLIDGRSELPEEETK